MHHDARPLVTRLVVEAFTWGRVAAALVATEDVPTNVLESCEGKTHQCAGEDEP